MCLPSQIRLKTTGHPGLCEQREMFQDAFAAILSPIQIDAGSR